MAHMLVHRASDMLFRLGDTFGDRAIGEVMQLHALRQTQAHHFTGKQVAATCYKRRASSKSSSEIEKIRFQERAG